VAAFAASAQTTANYSVTGVVTVNGTAVAGATMAISNVTGGAASNVSCVASGSNGVYSCTAPAGYGFKLTPSYVPSGGAAVTWTPASTSFGALAANQTANFAGVSSTVKYTLSGKVTVNGVAQSGVSMTVTGIDAAKVACSTSTSTGSYSCSAPAKASFTVQPKLTVPSGWTLSWTPPSATVSGMAGNSAASFAGILTSPVRHYLTIVTTVNGVRTNSVPLAISVTGAASQVACAKTTSLTTRCSIPANYGVKVTPSTANATVFTPASQTLSSMAVDTTMSFAGKR
jgi:hypothetical protein